MWEWELRQRKTFEVLSYRNGGLKSGLRLGPGGAAPGSAWRAAAFTERDSSRRWTRSSRGAGQPAGGSVHRKQDSCPRPCSALERTLPIVSACSYFAPAQLRVAGLPHIKQDLVGEGRGLTVLWRGPWAIPFGDSRQWQWPGWAWMLLCSDVYPVFRQRCGSQHLLWQLLVFGDPHCLLLGHACCSRDEAPGGLGLI